MKLEYDSKYFMNKAIEEAQIALSKGEVPIGAVVVIDNQIIARAHNLTETLNDVTAHAEMLAITSAADALGGKYLKDCQLYVTLEPCTMCAGALAWAQIGNIYFGATDEKRGAGRLSENIYHPKTKVQYGIMKNECAEIITSFFEERRD